MADIVAICAEHAVGHAAFAGKKLDGDALQTKGPGGEQVKGGVPGEIVDAGGGFKENNRCALGSGNGFGNTTRHLPNLKIIEMTGETALDILGIEIREFRKHFILQDDL